jgi:hypothetical protein
MYRSLKAEEEKATSGPFMRQKPIFTKHKVLQSKNPEAITMMTDHRFPSPCKLRNRSTTSRPRAND